MLIDPLVSRNHSPALCTRFGQSRCHSASPHPCLSPVRETGRISSPSAATEDFEEVRHLGRGAFGEVKPGGPGRTAAMWRGERRFGVLRGGSFVDRGAFCLEDEEAMFNRHLIRMALFRGCICQWSEVWGGHQESKGTAFKSMFDRGSCGKRPPVSCVLFGCPRDLSSEWTELGQVS